MLRGQSGHQECRLRTLHIVRQANKSSAHCCFKDVCIHQMAFRICHWRIAVLTIWNGRPSGGCNVHQAIDAKLSLHSKSHRVGEIVSHGNCMRGQRGIEASIDGNRIVIARKELLQRQTKADRCSVGRGQRDGAFVCCGGRSSQGQKTSDAAVEFHVWNWRCIVG